MKFEITATITTTREITGTINVKKKDLVDAGYPSSEDGDSTAWYGYVAEFLESEFSTHAHDYYPSDIVIVEDDNEAQVEDVTDIDINW